ncbi:MAG: deoxyhypusine synthase family protein [Candidatus Diapherotrites archaeon]
MKPVKQFTAKKKMTAAEIAAEMSAVGVLGAGRMGKAVAVAEQMFSDKECKVFFGVAGAMTPAGMRSILIEMLELGWIDVFVSTGANLTHDLVEALGYHHLKGSADADDKKLNKKGIDRIYESFMPNKVYIGLEKFCNKAFAEMPQSLSGKEFLWQLGEKVKNKKNILSVCAKKKIPIYCPALTDSGIGLMVNNWRYEHALDINLFDDLREINELAWDFKKKGIFYVGGGTPKNFIQQAMQFSPTPAIYGVQVTTDHPEFGGSSGAELREGISWGKMSPGGKFVDLRCDATIALPLIFAALKEKIG